jgi:hypothetical protein
MPNEPQPQGACELQSRWIEALGLPALVLPVDAHRWVLADNISSGSYFYDILFMSFAIVFEINVSLSFVQI